MLSLNKTALLAAVAVAVSVGGVVLISNYNNAIKVSKNKNLKINIIN